MTPETILLVEDDETSPFHSAARWSGRGTTWRVGVLRVLTSQRGKVVPRSRIMSEVWDENWYGSTKTLDVTIGRVRAKLEEARLLDRIVAVRGVGFRLEQAVDAD